LQLKVYYSRNDAHELRLAKKVAKDTSVAAVIGHRSSANAIPASIMYEYYGLLYVSPSASNNNLTNHAFAYTFRTIPYDRYVSHKTAVFMRKQGHRNIAIIDDSGVYGKGLADGVMESIGDLGMTTVVRRHYIPGKTNFKQMCAELTHHEFDAVFLGGILPSAAEFIREARQMGLTQCVYGGTAMDSLELTSIAGHAANGTIVPTWFNSELDNPQTSRFVSSFRKRFGKQPDSRAVLGYDSMNILFEAMKRSKSAEPSVVASNMRFIRNWPGVRGTYTFDLQGNLVCDEIYFKYLNQTRFDYFKDPVEDEDDEEDSDPE
jgi:branched-chain amino acid transport system substrate-binding protein